MRLVTLDEQMSWDPISLLALTPSQVFGAGVPLVPVRQLAEMLSGSKPTSENQAVVTPGTLNGLTGSVTRTRRDYAGLVRVAGFDPGQLRVGDVLVPRSPSLPAVLLGVQHAGLAFSEGFHALRPMDPTTGLLLWAVLSSSRGMQIRSASARGTMASLLGALDLLQLKVPVPVGYDQLVPALQTLVDAIPDPTEGDVARSWWRTGYLPDGGEWAFELGLQDPSLLNTGRPLGDFAEVVPGRRPAPPMGLGELLPVYDGVYLSRGEVRRWAVAQPTTGARPGDVLVGEVGVRGRARVVDAPGVVGVGVLRVRVRDSSDPAGLVNYLGSEAAQALRGALAQGAVIPRLSAPALRRFPVPDVVPAPETAPTTVRDLPLSLRLDELLWG